MLGRDSPTGFTFSSPLKPSSKVTNNPPYASSNTIFNLSQSKPAAESPRSSVGQLTPASPRTSLSSNGSPSSEGSALPSSRRARPVSLRVQPDPFKRIDWAKSKPPGAKEDEEFYLPDVIFLVEDRLFKVPRYVFEHNSEFFREIFSSSSSTSYTQSTSEDPAHLIGVSVADFKPFLRALLPKSPFKIQHHFLQEEWTSILKLSTSWRFRELRELAINALTGLLAEDPVEAVIVSRAYQVIPWQISALNTLVQRAKPIDMDEAKKLGFDIALKIAAIREGSVPNSNSNSSPATPTHPGWGSLTVHPFQASSNGKWVDRGSRSGIDFSDKIRLEFGLKG